MSVTKNIPIWNKFSYVTYSIGYTPFHALPSGDFHIHTRGNRSHLFHYTKCQRFCKPDCLTYPYAFSICHLLHSRNTEFVRHFMLLQHAYSFNVRQGIINPIYNYQGTNNITPMLYSFYYIFVLPPCAFWYFLSIPLLYKYILTDFAVILSLLK